MKKLLARVIRGVRLANGARLTLHAAGCSFFLVLSLFPALLVALSLLRATPLNAGDLTPYLERFLPRALLPEVEYLINGVWYDAPGAMMGVSALTALWSSSRGMLGLVRGMNVVYGLGENRPWLHTRVLSLLYTFAFFLLLLLTLAVQLAGEAIGAWLGGSQVRFFRFLGWMLGLRGLLLPALQTGLVAAAYCVFPNRKVMFRQALPGALTAVLSWQVFAAGFSVYVEHFGYANVYGSVYALALGLLWLYCCVLIFFVCGLLNRLLGEG